LRRLSYSVGAGSFGQGGELLDLGFDLGDRLFEVEISA
jgi:hypothetical protein